MALIGYLRKKMSSEIDSSPWGRSWDWEPPIVLIPGREGYFTNQKCVKITDKENTTLIVSPSHSVALRPNTHYIVSGKVRIDGETGLWLEANNKKIGKVITHDQKKRWTKWKREFMTSSDKWWLNKVLFRHLSVPAFVRDMACKIIRPE